jgi:hypothetical protein
VNVDRLPFMYRASVRSARLGVVVFCMLCAAPALAQDQPQQPLTTEQAEAAMKAAEANKDLSTLPAPPLEAPPPPPRHKGLVLEQSLGAVGFAGKFGGLTGHPAIWAQTQLGYEIFKWLMLFASADLAFTDTGSSVGPSQNRPFPIFGFGGGIRFTIPFTHRVGMYVQGSAGGDVAYVQPGVLANFGYRGAESLGFQAGGRAGIEWFQVDRHLALGLSGGARYMANLAYEVGGDLPLAWDATVDIRYTF